MCNSRSVIVNRMDYAVNFFLLHCSFTNPLIKVHRVIYYVKKV